MHALPAPPRPLLLPDHSRRLDMLTLSLRIERRVNDAFARHGDLWRLNPLRREIMRAVNDEIRAMEELRG